MAIPHPASATGKAHITLSDFELVRNARGEWLLVVPEWPSAWADNPLDDIIARVEDGDVLLESRSARMVLSSLIARRYVEALAADCPGSLLLSVVDDDGIQRQVRVVPFNRFL